MTTALLCSRCGAALAPHAASVAVTCSFCGTTSAPAPEVIERVVERVVVVTAESPADEAGDAGALGCPRCAKRMNRVAGGGHEALACPKCGGAFITNTQLEMFRKRRNDGLAKAVRLVSAFFLPLEPRRARLSCPDCAGALHMKEVEGTVYLMHVCAAHGAFFERDSLDAYNELWAEKRAGEIDEAALEAMGVRPKGFFDFWK